MDKVKFVEYSETYLELSWIWLNDITIKTMTMTPNITKEKQVEWFNSLKKRNDYYIWGIECEMNPIGAVGIKKVDFINRKGEYFGYIGNKEYWGQGIGSKMVQFVLKRSSELGLEEVYLHVSNDNKRAIRLYEKCGFIDGQIDAQSEILLLHIKLTEGMKKSL